MTCAGNFLLMEYFIGFKLVVVQVSSVGNTAALNVIAAAPTPVRVYTVKPTAAVVTVTINNSSCYCSC